MPQAPRKGRGNEDMAHPDEVKQVVVNRSGSILSASTILKSDFFSNLQKMTLPEYARLLSSIYSRSQYRILDALMVRLTSGERTSPHMFTTEFVVQDESAGGGLRRALLRVDAGPMGRIRFIGLLYVRATGVTTATVEAMENQFKKDILRELRMGNGRVLLHDEVEERPGVFSIVPLWELVQEDEIMTPRDVFNVMVKDGYRINYGRVAITDEQAPLPDALWQLVERVREGLSDSSTGDFIFNCQMGRGRTTTGMVTACLISTTMQWSANEQNYVQEDEEEDEEDEESGGAYDSIDGPSEEEAYLQGEYKTILQLVGVLSHGKTAKRMTDKAIDMMQDVQNLRKAIYEYVTFFVLLISPMLTSDECSYKLKVDACARGSLKEQKLRGITVNYLYRYGTLIAFANYLIEQRFRSKGALEATFPAWLTEHREITKILERRSLD
ncbi:inositol hexakisphosphate-domain-containing protein [Salix suchowensis]|nr:inositol hexakisphosphate-domain-containing protein [Salix suchowensis]